MNRLGFPNQAGDSENIVTRRVQSTGRLRSCGCALDREAVQDILKLATFVAKESYHGYASKN